MDYYLGDILLFGYNFAIQGFLACQGQTLAINQYQALYSLVGIKFGGDGINNFKLPNLSNALPNSSMGYFIVTEGVYPVRQ